MPANKPKNRTFVTVRKKGPSRKRGQTKKRRRGTTRHPV